jgi:hypothetical protein
MRRTAKEEDVVEPNQRERTHDASPEVLGAAESNGLAVDPPEPTEEQPAPVDSALLFQDWTIKRAERRVRRLFVALVLVSLVAGGWLAYLQTRLNEASVVPPPQRQTAPSSEDAALRDTLFGGQGPGNAQNVIGRIEERIADVERSVAESRQDGSRLGRCLSERLQDLDRNLRRLLERKVTANQYVSGPRIRSCS